MEGMQHVDDVGEANRVGSPVGLAIEVVNDLQHTRAAESLEWLGKGRFGASLGLPECLANAPLYFSGEDTQVFLAAADPADRFVSTSGTGAFDMRRLLIICRFRHSGNLRLGVSSQANSGAPRRTSRIASGLESLPHRHIHSGLYRTHG